MENRDRDKLNRSSDEESSKWEEESNESDASFDQKIGQSEDVEPGSRQSNTSGSSGMRGGSSESEH